MPTDSTPSQQINYVTVLVEETDGVRPGARAFAERRDAEAALRSRREELAQEIEQEDGERPEWYGDDSAGYFEGGSSLALADCEVESR